MERHAYAMQVKDGMMNEKLQWNGKPGNLESWTGLPMM